MRILVTELFWQEGIEELKNAGFYVDYNPELYKNPKKIKSIISNYNAIIVRNRTLVNETLLEGNNTIKVVGRLGVGLDNLNIDYLKKENIPVIIGKNANATSVAEYVLAAMLDSCRNLGNASLNVKRGEWNRKGFTGNELAGKNLALYGLGEISHRVAKRAKAFGMNVIGYDPFLTPYEHIYMETGVKAVDDLDSLLKQADFLSLHVPLTNKTKHVINLKRLKMMKKESVIINTARGGVIHENDLCDAIEGKVIAGAYLDVLEIEPPTGELRLYNYEKIKLTPHIAGLTNESQIRTSVLVAKEVKNVLLGKKSLCEI